MCITVPNLFKIGQNFMKIGKRLQRYGDLTVFKVAAVRHLGFVKFKFFNGRRGLEAYFASAYQIS